MPGLDEPPPLSEEKLIEYFTGLTEEELQTITWGGDRGTVIPLAGSDGVKHDFTPEEKEALRKAQKRRKKLQRKLARQAKGSKQRERTKEKLGRAYTKERTIREDRAHKISRTIVDSPAQVIAFEDLKVPSMVRRPKVRKDESGRFVRNGAKAKAALTRGILDSLWGRIVLFTKYKGLKVNKLTVKVAPHYSSMECSRCGHIHPGNRETQADFLCQECGFAVNADHNAALVIRKRAIQKLLCGEVAVREKKSVVFRRAEQIGQGLPESKRASCAGTAPEHRAGDYHKSH